MANQVKSMKPNVNLLDIANPVSAFSASGIAGAYNQIQSIFTGTDLTETSEGLIGQYLDTNSEKYDKTKENINNVKSFVKGWNSLNPKFADSVAGFFGVETHFTDNFNEKYDQLDAVLFGQSGKTAEMEESGENAEKYGKVSGTVTAVVASVVALAAIAVVAAPAAAGGAAAAGGTAEVVSLSTGEVLATTTFTELGVAGTEAALATAEAGAVAAIGTETAAVAAIGTETAAAAAAEAEMIASIDAGLAAFAADTAAGTELAVVGAEVAELANVGSELAVAGSSAVGQAFNLGSLALNEVVDWSPMIAELAGIGASIAGIGTIFSWLGKAKEEPAPEPTPQPQIEVIHTETPIPEPEPELETVPEEAIVDPEPEPEPFELSNCTSQNIDFSKISATAVGATSGTGFIQEERIYKPSFEKDGLIFQSWDKDPNAVMICAPDGTPIGWTTVEALGGEPIKIDDTTTS